MSNLRGKLRFLTSEGAVTRAQAIAVVVIISVLAVIGGIARFYATPTPTITPTPPTPSITTTPTPTPTPTTVTLADYPYPMVSNGLLNDTMVFPRSEPHGPCDGGSTVNVMAGVLIVEKLGLCADSGALNVTIDEWITTYDDATDTLRINFYVANNLIIIGNSRVNMVTRYYNDLLDEGKHVLEAYFEKDENGIYRIHVSSSSNDYYIEYDSQGRKKAVYGMIELYHDKLRRYWILIVAGLDDDGTVAAAKVLSTFEDWQLSGQVAVVKHYDSDDDGHLDKITVVEKR